MTARRTPNLPIRRMDDLELPMTGTWPVVRASSINRSTGRRRGLRQLPVLAGRFDVGEVPDDSSLRIDLDDSTLIAAAARVSPDRHGMSEWQFEGVAESAEGSDPLTLTMNYHGVFRRGVDVWAWLSGTGTIATSSRRGGLRRSKADGGQLVVDLLFNAPDDTRIPSISRVDRPQHSPSRVLQLPRLGSHPVVLGFS